MHYAELSQQIENFSWIMSCGCVDDQQERDDQFWEEYIAAKEAEYYRGEQVDWVRV